MAKFVGTLICYALFLAFGLSLGAIALVNSLVSNDGAFACINSIIAMTISAFGIFLIETHQRRTNKPS